MRKIRCGLQNQWVVKDIGKELFEDIKEGLEEAIVYSEENTLIEEENQRIEKQNNPHFWLRDSTKEELPRCVFDAVPVKQTSDGVSMSEELKPEVIIDDQSGYRVDKRYKVLISNMPKCDRIFIKYCNRATRSDERRTYKSNIELERILETELETAFAQGYKVCFQELAKPTFTKEDVEKVATAIYGSGFYNAKIVVENNLLPNKQAQQSEAFRYLEMVNNAKAALNAVGKVEE